MAQPADADDTNAIAWFGAGGLEGFVRGGSCAHQRAGVDALDGLRDRIDETGINDSIITESALVSIGEGEPLSFGAVLAIARSARFAMAT